MPTKELLRELREAESSSESGGEPGEGMAEVDMSWGLMDHGLVTAGTVGSEVTGPAVQSTGQI